MMSYPLPPLPPPSDSMSMLEHENKTLRQRITAMSSVKGPSILLEQLKRPNLDPVREREGEGGRK